MARYVIHACEGMYHGLHGVETYMVVECGSDEAAEDFAKEESINLMESYGHIIESFESEALEEGYEPGSDEFEEFIGECIQENIVYYIYDVKRGFEKTVDEMDKEICSDPEGFIERYC